MNLEEVIKKRRSVGAYIQLLLVDWGLASVWIGAFQENKIKKTLQIAKHLRPIAIIALGYSYPVNPN